MFIKAKKFQHVSVGNLERALQKLKLLFEVYEIKYWASDTDAVILGVMDFGPFKMSHTERVPVTRMNLPSLNYSPSRWLN